MQLPNSARRCGRGSLGALLATLLIGGFLGQLPAAPAQAAAGDAAARGVIVGLNANVLGLQLLSLNDTLGAANAPAGGGTSNGTGIGAANVGVASAAQVTATIDTVTATKASVKSSARSSVSGITVKALGLTVLDTGVISAEATCPATGAQTATTSTAGVRLLGDTVGVGVGGIQTRGANVSVSGLTGARLAVTLTRIENTTASSASATGLSVSLRLTAALGIDINLGSIAIATASCQKPAVPDVTATSITPTSGKQSGGTSVTVSGSGYVPGNTTVTVGGTPATVTNVSSDGTTVTFTTPAKAPGEYDVVVTSAGGKSAALRYTSLPDGSDATVNNPSPTSGFTAGGNQITITGSGLSAATGVNVGGTAATGVSVNGAGTTITATVPLTENAGAVPVTVLFPAGTVNAGNYTYNAPTVDAVAPAQGPTAGGTVVTLSGTGLTGTTALTFGGVAATNYSVNGAGTRITATVPAHAAGVVDVVATLPGADATLTGGYSYQPPGTPTITTVSPATGPSTGGTTVTLTGTNFTNVNAASLGGATATIQNKTATTLTLTTPVSENVGAVDITLSTSDNTTGTLPGAFTYNGPTLTRADPAAGPQSGGTVVDLTGTGLATASTVKVGGVSATITAKTDTTIRITTPAGAPGDAPITVQVDGHDPDPIPFTYRVDGSQASVTSVSPSTVPTSGKRVTISGTNLTGATGVTFGGIAGTNAVVNGAGTAITVTAPSTDNPGSAAVVLQFPEGTASAGSITYDPPTITSVTPAGGPAAGPTSVVVVGTNLTGATAVTFDGVAATGVTVNPAGTQIQATVPAHAPGVVDVAVVLSGKDAVAVSAYTYQNDGSQATVTAISPDPIPSSGGTVTITGTGLGDVSDVTFDGVSGTGLVATATQITIAAPATDAPGSAPIVLRFPAGTQSAGSLTYAAPKITAIQPAQGSTAGGTTVTIKGTGLSAATGVTFDGVAATNVTPTADGLTVTAPAHSGAGAVNVVVQLPGADATAAGGYAYVAPGAPTVSDVSPPSGPSSGGTPVTLTGTNFTGVTSVTFDGVAGTNLVVNSPTSVTVTTPTSSTTGAVDITVSSPNGNGILPGGYQYQGPELTAISPDNGAVRGGTSVTLTGTQFGTATQVTVGGTPVAFQVTSSSTLTFTTPAGRAGAARVAVDFPGTDPDPLTFTYVADGSNATVTNVAPSVPTAGGQVTVTGTNLTGANGVTFDGVAGTNVAVSSDGTSLSAAAPARESAGPASVVVQFPLGTLASGTAAYVGPRITTIAPDRGYVDGGNQIRISGVGISAATAVKIDGDDTTNFAVDQNGAITATVPRHVAGSVDVTVIVPGLDATSVGGYTYAPLPPPAISSISPATSPTAGDEVLTITGTNLDGATSVTIGGKPATIQGAPTATQIRATIPASEADSAVDVAVVTPNGSALSATQLKYVAPVIRVLDAESGPTSGGNKVSILGSGLAGATSVTFDGQAATIASADPAGSALTVTPPAHPVGATVDVAVILPGMDAAKAGGYRYVPDGSNVTVTAISPGTVPTAGDSITLQGQNFFGATAVTFAGTAGTDLAIDPSGSRITVTVPPSETSGQVTVLIWFPGGRVQAGTITYTAPSLYGVYPQQGTEAGGDRVTLTGIGFTRATGVTFDGVAATDVVVGPMGNTLTATSPAHSPGTVDVAVTLPGKDATLTGSYAYLDSTAPTVGSVLPAFGPTTGNTTVVITGTGLDNVAAVTFRGLAATIQGTPTPTSLTVVTPQVNGSGPADVVLTTAANVTSTVPRGFYYSGPTITSMSPSSGPAAGGTEVTIDGFALGDVQLVTVDGEQVTPTINAAGTRMTFTTPQGSPGSADVVLTYSGTSPQPQSFTYIADGTGASVTSISPNTVPASGGTVTLTGTGLNDATQVTFDGVPGTITNKAQDGSSMTVTAPPSSDNSADVRVVYPAGSTAAGTLSYGTPAVTAVTPQTGAESGGTQVTLTGTGLAAATGVKIDGRPVTFTASPDGTTVTFVTPAGTVGEATITIDEPGRTPAPARFTYLADGSSTTAVVSADTSATAGGNRLTIFGTGLKYVSRVLVGGQQAGNVTVNSAGTSLTADIPATETSGGAAVTLEFPAGRRDVGTVTYVGPTIASINPATGPVTGGTSVTITGTGLALATAVRFDGLAGSNTVVAPDGTSITVVTPTHAAGAVNVVVTLPGADATSTGGYTYVPATTPPISDGATPSSITPPQIPTYGGSTVTITGTGLAGVTGVNFDSLPGSGVQASETQVTVVSPAAEQGTVPVVLIFSDNSTKTAGTIEYTPPTITSVVPRYANITGGTLVTINGVNLQDAVGVTFNGQVGTLLSAKATTSTASVRALGTGAGASTSRGGVRIAVAPNSQVLAKAPANTAGTIADVSVVLPGADAASTRDVEYAAGPTASGMTPITGPTTGGTTVTISGSGFDGTTTVTFDNVAATNVTVQPGGTVLTAVVPAHAVGAVYVVVMTGGVPATPLNYTYYASNTGGGTTPPVTDPDDDDPDEEEPPVDDNPGGPTTPKPKKPPVDSTISPAKLTANKGGLITVTGANFVINGTAVKICGHTIPASQVVVGLGGTTATFRAPACPAGKQAITLSTAGGSTDTEVTFAAAAAAPGDEPSPSVRPSGGGTRTVTSNWLPTTGTDVTGLGVDGVALGGVVLLVLGVGCVWGARGLTLPTLRTGSSGNVPRSAKGRNMRSTRRRHSRPRTRMMRSTGLLMGSSGLRAVLIAVPCTAALVLAVAERPASASVVTGAPLVSPAFHERLVTSPGEASARVLTVDLKSASILGAPPPGAVSFAGLRRDGVAAVAPESGDESLVDVPLDVDAGTLAAHGVGTSVTAQRGLAGSGAGAVLDRFELTALGEPLVSVDRVETQVTCPPAGSTEPTAQTAVSGLRVEGEPTETGGTVPVGGAQVGVELQKTAQHDAGGAHAAVVVALTATAADGVTTDLGTIHLTTTTCLPPEPATTPVGAPADGTPAAITPADSTPEAGTPGSRDPGNTVPGTNAPGGEAPGARAPGSALPGTSAPGVGTPGWGAPSVGAPGRGMPNAGAPGSTAPGRGAPARGMPGTSAPGTTAPAAGGAVPETAEPAAALPAGAPGHAAPGKATPGSTTPSQTAPGQTAPSQTAPGQTTPSQTTPSHGNTAKAPAAPEAPAADPLLIGPPAAPVAALPQRLFAALAPISQLTFGRAPATGLRPPSLTRIAGAPRAAAGANPTISGLTPARGPADGGTKITITGANLGGADTTVVICNAKVSAGAVTVSSDGTSLTLTSPPCTAGTSVVHVITTGGVATSQFTYGGTTSPATTARQVAATTSNSMASPRNTLATTSPQNLAAGLIGALLLFAGFAARQAARRGPVRAPIRGRHAMRYPDPQVIGQGWHPDLDDALRRRGA